VNYSYETVEQVYKFILDYKSRSGGNSPAYRKIASEVGLASTSTVKKHLDTLEALGLTSRDEDGGIVVVGGKWLPPVEEAGQIRARQAGPKKSWGLLSRVPLEEVRRLRQRMGVMGAAQACGVSRSTIQYHLRKI
jgi:DNA-binding transcriptional ArsR family regulator